MEETLYYCTECGFTGKPDEFISKGCPRCWNPKLPVRLPEIVEDDD